MKIEVTTDNEVLFNGDADDFLEANDYDEELEELLNELNNEEEGVVFIFYGNQGTEYEIEKLEDSMEEE